MAFSLNALIGEENDKYAEVYQGAHSVQAGLIKEGMSVSQAEVGMKSGEVYKIMLKQKGKVEQIMEFIRISKIRGSQADREYDLNP